MKKIIAVFVFGFLLVGNLGTQQTTVPVVTTPEPYDPGEFSPWLRDLDRGKTLAFGAFPFAYLLTNLGYDIIYYLNKPEGIRENYRPWPAGQGTGSLPPSEQNEKYKLLLLTSAGISLGLAVLDYVLGLSGVDDGGISD